MDSLVPFVVPALLGGAVCAIGLFLWNRTAAPSLGPTPSGPPLSTDIINMAQVNVAGIGGLGLIAMAAVVAWNIPRIGTELAIGLVGGVVLAAGLVAWRRHH
jgi:hypothetical protein